MRCLIQRVEKASVYIEGKLFDETGAGLLLFLGVEDADLLDDINWMVKKIIKMRIFSDENDKMNLSVQDINGEILVISQFTLFASTKKGNRPSFIKAARPDKANKYYEIFITELKNAFQGRVGNGKFGANMKVALINDGPVTIWMDSKDKE